MNDDEYMYEMYEYSDGAMIIVMKMNW